MAFRLKNRKSVGRQLSRIVTKEFAGANAELSIPSVVDDEDAIHGTRKRVKKIRAVLRLCEKDLGDNFRLENQRLRNVTHELSPLRDADAILQIVKSMRDRYPELITSAVFASVRRGLLRRRRAAAASLTSNHAVGKALLDLSAISRPPQIRKAIGLSEVRTGVMRGYRRARIALATATPQSADTLFHAWRRRVKNHWYHMRLLEGLNPRAKERAKRLKRLETWLGDDHNLALTRASMLDRPTDLGNARVTTVLLGCIDKYQAVLRRRALRLGNRLFARKPRAFRRAIHAWLR
jgi:CHAD domain-containing protein